MLGNELTIIGRIATDVDLRYTAKTQVAVAYFKVAVNRQNKDDGAVFIRCKVWKKKAELIEKYFKKGDGIILSGKWEQDVYEKEGQRYWYDYMFIEDFKFPFVNAKAEEAKPEPKVEEAKPEEPVPDFANLDSDMPF